MKKWNIPFKLAMILLILPFLMAGCKAPWEPSSEQVVRNMANAMSTLSSFKIDPAKITATGKFVAPEDYEELVSGQQPEPTVTGTVNMNITGQTETFYKTNMPDYTYNVSSTMKMKDSEYPFSYESLAMGPLVFLKFTKMPGYASEYVDLTGITNKWWEIPRSQAPAVYYPVPEVQTQPQKDEPEEQELTEAQVKELEELVSKTTVVKVLEDFGKEKCKNGKTAYHYKVTVDEASAKALYVGYYEITGQSFTAEQLDEFEDLMKAIAGMNIETWIQKKDFYLCKTTASGEFKSPETGQTYNVSADIDLTDFNAEMTVQEPAGAQAFSVDNIMKALGINLDSIIDSVTGGSEDLDESLDELQDNLAPLKDEIKKLFE